MRNSHVNTLAFGSRRSVRQRTGLALSLGAALLSSSTGCSIWKGKSASTKEGWSISKLWTEEYEQPNEIAAIWAPDVLTVAGATPTRGFGGRIYFYNAKHQSISVDGDLMVYGYNGDLRTGEQVEADKTFGFTAEQLKGHFSPSDMGASYSVWIPWDAQGGARQVVTLIPVFKTADGGVVQGSPAKLYLPGKGPQAKAESSVKASTVSYQTPAADSDASDRWNRSYQATTIKVPDRATIARPTTLQLRSLQQLRAHEATSKTSPILSGVSVGGQAAFEQPTSSETEQPTGPSMPSLTPLNLPAGLPTLPPVNYSQAVLEQLPPPADTASSSSTHQPTWQGRDSAVTPASYTR